MTVLKQQHWRQQQQQLQQQLASVQEELVQLNPKFFTIQVITGMAALQPSSDVGGQADQPIDTASLTNEIKTFKPVINSSSVQASKERADLLSGMANMPADPAAAVQVDPVVSDGVAASTAVLAIIPPEGGGVYYGSTNFNGYHFKLTDLKCLKICQNGNL